MRGKKVDSDDMKTLMESMSRGIDLCEDKVSEMEGKEDRVDHKLSGILKMIRHHKTWVK